MQDFLIELKYMQFKENLSMHFKENLSSCSFTLALINAIAVSFVLLQLSFACNPAFFSTWEKSYKDIYHPSPYLPGITENILITIRFIH